jgi:hypothetical protein
LPALWIECGNEKSDKMKERALRDENNGEVFQETPAPATFLWLYFLSLPKLFNSVNPTTCRWWDYARSIVVVCRDWVLAQRRETACWIADVPSAPQWLFAQDARTKRPRSGQIPSPN